MTEFFLRHCQAEVADDGLLVPEMYENVVGLQVPMDDPKSMHALESNDLIKGQLRLNPAEETTYEVRCIDSYNFKRHESIIPMTPIYQRSQVSSINRLRKTLGEEQHTSPHRI